MFKTPYYLAFGLASFGLIGWNNYRGMGDTNVTEAKVSPKSIRDNPGAYRSSYGYIPRYSGGK